MKSDTFLDHLQHALRGEREPLQVTIVTAMPSVGGRHMVPVQGIHAGFDWEKGKLIITPAERLFIRTSEDEVKHLQRQLDEAMRKQMVMRSALQAAQKLCTEALPKFNWGASALDANAIRLLNEVPSKIAQGLAVLP